MKSFLIQSLGLLLFLQIAFPDGLFAQTIKDRAVRQFEDSTVQNRGFDKKGGSSEAFCCHDGQFTVRLFIKTDSERYENAHDWLSDDSNMSYAFYDNSLYIINVSGDFKVLFAMDETDSDVRCLHLPLYCCCTMA